MGILNIFLKITLEKIKVYFKKLKITYLKKIKNTSKKYSRECLREKLQAKLSPGSSKQYNCSLVTALPPYRVFTVRFIERPP